MCKNVHLKIRDTVSRKLFVLPGVSFFYFSKFMTFFNDKEKGNSKALVLTLKRTSQVLYFSENRQQFKYYYKGNELLNESVRNGEC